MGSVKRIRRIRRILLYTASFLLALFFFFLIFVDNFVEPMLRKRIHTLIIEGSDSLYTYKLGGINANFFGGNVEVENLQINTDSNRYEILRRKNALPSLTMQLELGRGQLRGISVISLLLGNKVRIEEIISKEADIRLSRHVQSGGNEFEKDEPLWKAIQPDIEGIYVKRIKLDGVKLLYRNADTAKSVKLQFDRCDALFEDIAVDSVSASDTGRIGFTRDIFMKFHDLKFRSFDSTYKLKAEWITYSSKNKTLEVDSFKIQPTLEKEDFYKAFNIQKSLYYIEFVKARFTNLHIDRYLHNNIIEADSIFFDTPNISIYRDRTYPAESESKIGKYPHQKLLNSNEKISIKNIGFDNGRIRYTEKNEKSEKKAELLFRDLKFHAGHVTNDSIEILKRPVCTASVEGNLFGKCPLQIQFSFYLDSLEGQYEAKGSVKNISASQLNPLAMPLTNVLFNSFHIHQLDFLVRGQDFEAVSEVRMPYNNLSITIRKDEETGSGIKKFLTRILNKYVLWPDNPGPDGIERRADHARVTRLSTQSFFGLLWKSIFAGMQEIMMKP